MVQSIVLMILKTILMSILMILVVILMTFILSSTGREDSAQLCVYVGGEKVLVKKYLLSVNIKHGRYIETLSWRKNGRFF